MRFGGLPCMAIGLALAVSCGGKDSASSGSASATGTGGVVLDGGDDGPKLDVENGGTAMAGDEGDTGCDSQLFGSDEVPPNVLIVLDRSHSMESDIGGGTKWDIARDALAQVTAAHASDVYFGLMLFPGTDQACNNGQQCSPGAVFVDPAPGTAMQINAFLQGAGTCMYGTPIAENLTSLLDYQGLKDTERANYILLVTDGQATCNDPVPVVTQLRSEDPEIKTFVVGFGGQVDPQQLTDMAVEGGTALPGDPKYYQADDAAALAAALSDITGSVLSCDLQLQDVPDDLSQLFAFLDDMLVDRDTSHMDGWDYDPATNRITFYGPACDAIQAGTVGTVSIVFGCPVLPPEG